MGYRGYAITAATYSPDGSMLVAVHDGFVTLWDALHTRLASVVMLGGKVVVKEVQFVGDGTYVVGYGEDAVVAISLHTSSGERIVFIKWC